MAALTERTAEPVGCLVVSGRLDVSTVSEVRGRLHAAVDTGYGDLMLDLSGLELVDATGLGMLLGTHRRAALAGRRLVLCDVPPRVSRLLVRTRLHRVLHVQRMPLAVA